MTDAPIVLIVDDEAKIGEILTSYLEASGCKALYAPNGSGALRLFDSNDVSLILLDLMLPDVTGEELCRRVRERSDIPIIMITAKVEERDIINGLNIGADDYVCKPFSPRELMARVKAHLRRSSGRAHPASKKLTHGDLSADLEKRCITVRGKELALTRDEYLLVSLFLSRPAKIFTRDEIIAHIKGDDYDGFDRTIDTHIKNLRQKLEDDPRKPKYIETVYGMGYRLAEVKG
ncbi:response regulator transcription factor [Breznakiellaceae bacterium SP9]